MFVEIHVRNHSGYVSSMIWRCTCSSILQLWEQFWNLLWWRFMIHMRVNSWATIIDYRLLKLLFSMWGWMPMDVSLKPRHEYLRGERHKRAHYEHGTYGDIMQNNRTPDECATVYILWFESVSKVYRSSHSVMLWPQLHRYCHYEV